MKSLLPLFLLLIQIQRAEALPEWMEYSYQNPSGYQYFQFPNDPETIKKEEALRLKVLELAIRDNQIDQYPEQQALLLLGSFWFGEHKYDLALDYFKQALAIAEKAVNTLWTAKLEIKDRANYLPAYQDPEDELKGKYQNIVNLRSWVAETLFKLGRVKESDAEVEKTLELMDEKKINQVIVQIKLFELKSNLLKADGKTAEAEIFSKKAKKLRSTLDN